MDARRLRALSAVFVAMPTLAGAADVDVQDFLACSGVVEDTVRLACYDNASREHGTQAEAVRAPQQQAVETGHAPAAAVTVPTMVAQVEAADARSMEAREEATDMPSTEARGEVEDSIVVAASVKSEERYAPLTDDVGLSALERDDAEGQQIIRGTVTACRRDASGKYLFYFDNGQIWKQSGSTHEKYEDCEFSVSIMRDTFGFRMQPDGEMGRIRIKRIK